MIKSRKLNILIIILAILAINAYCLLRYDFEEELPSSGLVLEKVPSNDDYNDSLEEDNTSSVSDSVLLVIEDYPDMKEMIKSGNMKLPLLGSMIPQGIAVLDEYIIISAYDYKNGEPSLLNVLDRDGELINQVRLDTNSHVGSIAYDELNELLWIPGNDGVLNAYDAKDILEDNAIASYKFDNVKEFLSKDHYGDYIDYLTVDGRYLYVGSFSWNKNGIVKKYEIKNQGGYVSLDYINKFVVPSLVQGISFYEYGGVKYMILSRSFGRKNDSYLGIYKFDEKTNDYTIADKVSFNLPPMLEQVTVYDNDLYMVFESASQKYEDSSVKIDSICVLSLERMMESLKR